MSKTQKLKNTKTQTEVKIEDPQIAILKNQLARTLADYDNLQKRTQEEKVTWIKFATQKFIQNLLPVLDTFEAAQVHLKDSGLAIAINQFKEELKNEGLEEIRPKAGDNFDENFHEVIEVVPSEVLPQEGKIAELLVAGWKFIGGLVVRHAKVKVYKVKEAEKSS